MVELLAALIACASDIEDVLAVVNRPSDLGGVYTRSRVKGEVGTGWGLVKRMGL